MLWGSYDDFRGDFALLYFGRLDTNQLREIPQAFFIFGPPLWIRLNYRTKSHHLTNCVRDREGGLFAVLRT
jgi:hypothetical protein